MTKGKIKGILSDFKKKADKNRPAIYTGTAIAGVVLTSVTAYKAGKRVQEIIESHKEISHLSEMSSKEKKEVIFSIAKEAAPALLAPIIIGGATIACIFCANHESSKRITALSAAYAVSEKSLKELNTKMEDTFGIGKVQKLKENIAKDHVQNNPPKEGTQVILTGDGDVLCMDSYTGRYFRSNAQKIGQAINQLSSECGYNMFTNINEFYDLLGLAPIPIGEDLGWNAEDLIRGQVPITYTAVLTPDEQPCLVVDYGVNPRTDYRNLH